MVNSNVGAVAGAIVAALVMTGMTGCAAETAETAADSGNASADAESPAREAPPSDTPMAGAWALVSFGPAAGLGETAAGIETTLAGLPADRPVTLDLTEPGRVAGHSGCNDYFSEFRVESGHTIQMGPVGSTRKACEEGAMQLEQTFLRSLEAATMIFAGDGELELHDADGVLMIFGPLEPAE